MFKTTSYDQDEILHAIMGLYLRGKPIYLDPMYGRGGFYKKSVAPPQVAMDILPGQDVAQGDARSLPFEANSIESMILDPPFMHAQGKDSALSRYASYPSQKALRALYDALIIEAYRALIPGGILIFKCQDTVESGKQVWNHVYVQERAIVWGFEPVDLFILLARSRMTGHNHARQVHARKHHAFFWVFRKPTRRTKANSPMMMIDAQGNTWVQLPMEDASGTNENRDRNDP